MSVNAYQSYKVVEVYTYIQCQRFAAVFVLVSVNTYQSLAVLEESRLQTDDNELHTGGSVVVDVVGNPSNVGVVKRSIDLVENEERRRLVGMDSEQQCQSRHCLLTTREVLHISESFQWGHGVVFNAVEVWLI